MVIYDDLDNSVLPLKQNVSEEFEEYLVSVHHTNGLRLHCSLPMQEAHGPLKPEEEEKFKTMEIEQKWRLVASEVRNLVSFRYFSLKQLLYSFVVPIERCAPFCGSPLIDALRSLLLKEHE
jgi:hypothetical protein